MKLSEIKGEHALDVLADLLDPISEIVSDKEIATIIKSKMPKVKIIKPAIKNHKKAVIQALALLDGVPPEEYEVNLLTLPLKILEILNDPMIEELFSSQSQTMGSASSGSATENTGEEK
jgi:hypothetical protein